MHLLKEYSLTLLILILTFVAAVLTLAATKLLGLNPPLAGLAGVGMGMLFGVILLILAQYGSTIEPITQDEYDDLNDPELNFGGNDDL